LFDSFQDAVAYKVDRDNRWTSVKDKNGDWNEICPSCNAPEVIAELKGIEIPQGNKKTDKTAAKLAALAAELFEGF
jgi:DNA polymerase III delta subunit